MITPEEFPYIRNLRVNDCYAYKDFRVELHSYTPFSHLILTGKNGSGKSTILRYLHNYFLAWRTDSLPLTNAEHLGLHINILKTAIEQRIATDGIKDSSVLEWQFELDKYDRVYPYNSSETTFSWKQSKGVIVYSYFPAKRTSDVDNVEAPSKENEFIEKLNAADSTDFFIRKFKQYLVNQKVEQAFSQIENQTTRIGQVDKFFKILEDTFRKTFEDNLLRIEFIRSNYEFYLKLSDGRQLTFDTLSEGFSALLSILMDLFMRVDLIRKKVGDYTYNPCGVVLIDEPETHLHLELQEQVFPLLTMLFPNVQIIAATHSPVIIASIKNATIFDLTTKENRGSEDTVGRSYSDLMTSHFGLDNEYSATADAIIKQVNEALNSLADKSVEKQAALQKIYDENSAYLSPTLKVELELLIAQQEAQQIAHQ